VQNQRFCTQRWWFPTLKRKLTVMIPSPLRGLGHSLRAFPGPRYACPGLISKAPPGPDRCDGLVDNLFHSSWVGNAGGRLATEETRKDGARQS